MSIPEIEIFCVFFQVLMSIPEMEVSCRQEMLTMTTSSGSAFVSMIL